MTGRRSYSASLVALLLIAPTVVLSQGDKPKRTLIINGQSSDVPLIQVNGHPYVGLEALADALQGSLSSAGTKFALSLPTPSSATFDASAAPARSAPAPAQPAPSQPPADPGLSREFLRAGIEAMSNVREWHTALESSIQNGFISAGVLEPYRAAAVTSLRLAGVAATTPSDKNAYQLLTNGFQMMAGLSDKYIQKRANLTYIAPDALKNDDVNQRLITCGHSLGAMAASGQFTDDGTCH